MTEASTIPTERELQALKILWDRGEATVRDICDSLAERGDFTPTHEEADMTSRWVPLDELVGAVLDKRITDGPLALAVLAYAHRRLRTDD